MATGIYAFVFASAISVIVTPIVRKIAIKLGALDKPIERSVHTNPIPYLGGIAIFLGFTGSTLLFLGVEQLHLLALILGGLLVVILGIIDDVKHLPAWAKFLGQILVGLFLVALGVKIEWLTVPFLGMKYLGVASVPLTILWIVAMMNVVNLTDGLDGLAAGVSAIASTSLLLVAAAQGQAEVVALTAALAGSCLGFLPYNFHPARIFMGDAGAMFLGYTLATISVEGALKTTTTMTFVVPLLAMGLPIFDTSFAIIRRVVNGRPVYEADKEHIHHRLLEIGLTQRHIVLLMYGVTALLGGSAVMLEIGGVIPGLLTLGATVGVFVLAARRSGLLEIRR